MEGSKLRIIYLLFFLLYNCATVFGSSKYPVYVETNTKDASILFLCIPNSRMQWNPVYLEKGKTEISPTVFFQKANESCKIRVEKANYISQEREVEKKINPSFIQNIPWIIAIFPPIVDLFSGHWRKPDSKVIKIHLKLEDDGMDKRTRKGIRG